MDEFFSGLSSEANLPSLPGCKGRVPMCPKPTGFQVQTWLGNLQNGGSETWSQKFFDWLIVHFLLCICKYFFLVDACWHQQFWNNKQQTKAPWSIYLYFDLHWWNGAVCMCWTLGWLFGHVGQHYVCWLIPQTSRFGVLALASAMMTSWLLHMESSKNGQGPIELRILNSIHHNVFLMFSLRVLSQTPNLPLLWFSPGTVSQSSLWRSYGAINTRIPNFLQKLGMHLDW